MTGGRGDTGTGRKSIKRVAPSPVSQFPVPEDMPITHTEVKKIAKLANLELTDEEKENFSGQLAAIVEYIDQLNEVDTSAVKAWQTRSAGEAVTSYASRSDTAESSLGQEKALDQAPDADEGHFLVPRVIGG
jgi:aspartyl-tRNA(Asn)/glutamyl-tRNA(Gln) amidotransferase subunit C